MSKLFRFGLYTTQDFGKAETARIGWEKLAEPIFDARFYDSVEDARIPFSTDEHNAAALLFETEGVLFVTAKKSGILAAFNRQTGKLATWDFYIPLADLKGARAEKWRKWIFDWCGRLPVVFGFGCSILEYNAKHQTVRNLPGGGRVTGWAGVSIKEFGRYLPGFYWLNIFGHELASAFGRETFDRLPHVKTYPLDEGQTAIVLDEPIVPGEMEERLLRERRLAEQIAESCFFDLADPEKKYRQIPQLRALVE
ncbi:MAG TPA: hypothetical protein VIL74_13560 [Pyrinomonadaceae bacterium]|jgi:hypothetical protein